MSIVTKDFREIFSAEIVSITGGLLAGLLLVLYIDKIYLVPGIFILLPGFLEMRGNISGSMSARLSSGLFLGALKTKSGKKRILKGNIIASMVLVVLVSILLGIISYLVSYFIFGVNFPQIIFVSFLAAVLSNIIQIPLTIFTTLWLFKRGHDPNNIMGPYITTTGDIISIVSLLIAIFLV